MLNKYSMNGFRFIKKISENPWVSRLVFIPIAMVMILLNIRFAMSVFFIGFIDDPYSKLYFYFGVIYFLIWIVVYAYLVYRNKNKYRFIGYNLLLNFLILLFINHGNIMSSFKDYLSLVNLFE